ncbi:hypothetical protein ACVWZX_004195 [Deinococcus sp. UYEF24]
MVEQLALRVEVEEDGRLVRTGDFNGSHLGVLAT